MTFKAKLCCEPPPGEGGWMSPEARRGCIRHGGHEGPHRNRRFQWEHGRSGLAYPRPDRAELPEGAVKLLAGKYANPGFVSAWRWGFVVGRHDAKEATSTRNPYTDWRTDRGSVTFSRAWGNAWRDGYETGKRWV